MKLQIENVRSIESASLELSAGGLTEVAEPNGYGKTTIAACLSACLARNPDPMFKGATARSRYIRRGVDPDQAVVTLSGDDWSIVWHVGAGEFQESGQPPPRPPSIVGHALRTAWEGKPDDIARAWLEALLSGAFTQAEIAARIADTLGEDVPDAQSVADKLAEEIDADPLQGWDRAADFCKDRGQEAKREWEKAVASDGQRERFGDKKAFAWRPRAWRPELEGTTLAALETLLQQMRERETVARDQLAVTDAKIEQQAERNEAVREASRKLSALEDEYNALAHDIDRANEDAGGPTEDEREKARRRVDAAQARVQELGEEGTDPEHEAAQNTLAEAEAELHENERLLRERQRSIDELDAQIKRVGRQIREFEDVSDTCPHCGQPMPPDFKENRETHLSALRGEHEGASEKLSEAVELFQATRRDIEGNQTAIGVARGRLSELTMQRQTKARETARVRDDYNAAMDAWRDITTRSAEADSGKVVRDMTARRDRIGGQIEALRSNMPATDSERIDRAPAENAVHKAVDGVRMVVAGVDAFKCYTIAQNQATLAAVWGRVQAVLSPRGMRSEKVGERVEQVNKMFGIVRDQCELPNIQLGGQNPRVSWNHGRVEDASASEQWLTASVLRALVCALHKAPVAVMDAADVLQPSTRARLKATMAQIAQGTGIAILWTETKEQ